MAEIITTNSAKELAAVMQALGQDIDSNTMTEEQLRDQAVAFAIKLDQLFNPDKSTLSVESFSDKAVFDSIQEQLDTALNAPNENGVTGLQLVQAIAEKDVDFLVKDIANSGDRLAATMALKGIYAFNSGDDAVAAQKVLEFIGTQKPEVQVLVDRLKTFAPEIWNNLPETLVYLNDSDKIFENLDDVYAQGLFEKEADASVVAAADPVAQREKGVKLVEETIGLSVDGVWGEVEQAKLKEHVAKLLEDKHYAEGWSGKKDGVLTSELLNHLTARAAELPSATPEDVEQKEKVQELLGALKGMQDSAVALISAEDALTVEQATSNVILGLNIINPKFNTAIEAKGEEYGALAEMFAGDLMGIRLAEGLDENAGTGWKFQGSVQGLMTVLGHSQVLDMNTQLPHLQPWEWHPDKGQYLLRDESLDKILSLMGDDGGLTKEELRTQLEMFIQSMNLLYREGKLLDFQVFNGSLMEVSAYAKGILVDETERLSGLEGGNDLFNELTRAYTGIGLDQILDEGQAPDFADAPVEYRERLKAFYSQAKTAHTGTDEEFEAEILIMLHSITSLPFGDARHSSVFVPGVMDAMRSGDADAFVEGVEQTVGKMVEAAGKPEFKSALVRNPTLHPKLQDSALSFTSGGKDFTTDDIINAYNEMSKDYGDGNGGAMAFRADGKIYVSAVEVRANIFTIEEINADKLNEIFFTQEKLEEVAPEYAGQTLSQEQRNDIFCDLIYTKGNVPIFEGAEESIASTIFTDDKVALAMAEDAGFSTMFQSSTMDAQNVVKLWASYPDFLMAVNNVKTPSNSNKISPLDAVIQRNQPQAAPLVSDVPPVGVAAPRVDGVRGAANPDSKPFTVADFKANSVRLQGLADAASTLYSRPTVLSAEQVAFLRSQSGSAGDGALELLEVSVGEVDASAISEDTKGPVLGYYDRERQAIVMVPLPDEFRDPAQAGALREAVKKEDGVGSKQHYDDVVAKYPKLAEIAEASYESEKQQDRASGVVNNEDRYAFFADNLRGTVTGVQYDLGQRTSAQTLYKSPFETVQPEVKSGTPFRDAFRGAGNRIKGVFGGQSGETKAPREPVPVIYRGDNPYGYERSDEDAEAAVADKMNAINEAGGEITQIRIDSAVQTSKNPEVTVVGGDVTVKPHQ